MKWRGLAGYANDVAPALRVEQLAAAHVAAVPRLISADAYGMYSIDSTDFATTTLAFDGASSGLIATYERLGREHDPCFQQMLKTGHPVNDQMVFKGSLLPDPSPYAKMLRRCKLGHTMQAPLLADDRLLGTINFARSPRLGPFTRDELAFAEQLARHAALALARTRSYDELYERCLAAEWAVGASRDPLIVSSLSGRVSARSEALSDQGSCAEESLRAALRASGEALAGIEDRQESTLSLDGELSLVTVRVPGTTTMMATRVLGTATPTPRIGTLGGLLTPREAEVLELAGKGLRDAEIADRICVTVHTVKQHLKHVYAKLGAHSRSHALNIAWRRAQQRVD